MASTELRKGSLESSFSPSRMVCCSSSAVVGCSLASCRVLTVCSRMDCIRGPHCSHRPRATLTTESAVRSRSAKTRVSSRLMPGVWDSSARSISLTLSTRDSGTCSSSAPTRSAWGSTTTMASPSLPAAFSLQLVADDVVHQGGLAHAGAGHVEVVAAQQVLGEVDGLAGSRRGVAHQGAALHSPGRGQQATGAGPFHQRGLVSRPRRVPEAGHLADPPGCCACPRARVG